MTVGFIYKIHFPNGKHYIGLTTNSLAQRNREHKSSAKNGDTGCLLYKALKKYNMVDTFELIEIDTADTLEELCKKEIKYIEEYNSHYITGNGYNMTIGGEGVIGYIYTDESRQKISEAQKKRFDDPEERQKMSEAAKKRFDDPDEIKKISEAQNKRWKNLEERQKMSEAQKKRFDDPEERQKMSEAAKKRFDDPDEIKKISEISTEYWKNPDARQQHSERMKQYYEEHPEAIQRMSEISTEYWENSEVRVIMSETLKNYYEKNPDALKKMSERGIQYHNEHPEAAKKQSETLKNYYEKNPDALKKILDTKGQNKPFDVFREDGTFIKTFTYQIDAREYFKKEHNITSTIKISEVLGGHRKSSAGFVFKYK